MGVIGGPLDLFLLNIVIKSSKFLKNHLDLKKFLTLIPTAYSLCRCPGGGGIHQPHENGSSRLPRMLKIYKNVGCNTRIRNLEKKNSKNPFNPNPHPPSHPKSNFLEKGSSRLRRMLKIYKKVGCNTRIRNLEKKNSKIHFNPKPPPPHPTPKSNFLEKGSSRLPRMLKIYKNVGCNTRLRNLEEKNSKIHFTPPPLPTKIQLSLTG